MNATERFRCAERMYDCVSCAGLLMTTVFVLVSNDCVWLVGLLLGATVKSCKESGVLSVIALFVCCIIMHALLMLYA